MTKLLTYQISTVPDKGVKENIKDNVSKNANLIGMEDELRGLLDKQGLLHGDNK